MMLAEKLEKRSMRKAERAAKKQESVGKEQKQKSVMRQEAREADEKKVAAEAAAKKLAAAKEKKAKQSSSLRSNIILITRQASEARDAMKEAKRKVNS